MLDVCIYIYIWENKARTFALQMEDMLTMPDCFSPACLHRVQISSFGAVSISGWLAEIEIYLNRLFPNIRVLTCRSKLIMSLTLCSENMFTLF